MTLLAKDLKEILRTWRIWLLGLVVLFASVTGPLLARYMGEIMGTLGGAELEGFTASLPDPTYFSAHAQWISDLNQLVILGLALVAGSTIAGELADESYLFTLTRRVPRWKFLASKIVAVMVVLVGLVVLGAAVNSLVTWLVFDKVDAGALIGATALWLLSTLLVVMVAALVGVLTSSPVGAAAGAIGVVMAFGIVSMWEPATKWSPVGVASQAGALSEGGSIDALWPLVSSLVFAAVLFGCAVFALNRREL